MCARVSPRGSQIKLFPSSSPPLWIPRPPFPSVTFFLPLCDLRALFAIGPTTTSPSLDLAVTFEFLGARGLLGNFPLPLCPLAAVFCYFFSTFLSLPGDCYRFPLPDAPPSCPRPLTDFHKIFSDSDAHQPTRGARSEDDLPRSPCPLDF